MLWIKHCWRFLVLHSTLYSSFSCRTFSVVLKPADQLYFGTFTNVEHFLWTSACCPALPWIILYVEHFLQYLACFSATMEYFIMYKIFFMRCRTFSLRHFTMSNKFCGSYNGVENYLSNIIHWQNCQTLVSICRKNSVALHKACRTFSIEHFDVENLPWSMGKRIVEHFLSKIVCFPN